MSARLPARTSGRVGARARARWLALLPAALFVLPLAAALAYALADAFRPAAWRELVADPQLPTALRHTLVTAVGSTLASLGLAMVLAIALHGSAAWHALTRRLGVLLAVPHAAFAIGLMWLVAPVGPTARLLGALFDWQAPPAWASVNDAHALGLTAVLVLKETPFLLWHLLARLARPDVAGPWARQLALARTLGHAKQHAAWRLAWAQWLPPLGWPLVAVLAYGLAVVDVALVAGPGTPPTLAVLAWQALNDGDVQRQALGSARTLLLVALLAVLLGASTLAARGIAPLWRRHATNGVRGAPSTRLAGWARALLAVLVACYAAVAAALLVLSVMGAWPFAQPWPERWTLDAWRTVASALPTLALTVALALASAAVATAGVVVWLETVPQRWDGAAGALVMTLVALPALLVASGLYRAALALRLDGSVLGLAWAHALVVLPYAYLALQPAWRGLDPRHAQLAASLGQGRWRTLWRVKRPLLAAPLAAAFAVGIAVSSAQFLVTQFVGAGRHATITTEAVTLASGGQRALAAAFALLQALLPALAFAWAERVGRTSAATAGATGGGGDTRSGTLCDPRCDTHSGTCCDTHNSTRSGPADGLARLRAAGWTQPPAGASAHAGVA